MRFILYAYRVTIQVFNMSNLRWQQNKGCVLVHGSHAKTELMIWCQREIWHNLNGNPVCRCQHLIHNVNYLQSSKHEEVSNRAQFLAVMQVGSVIRSIHSSARGYCENDRTGTESLNDTGRPFRLIQTSRWQQNKRSVLVWRPCTKREPLFWCQPEVWINLNGDPVESHNIW